MSKAIFVRHAVALNRAKAKADGIFDKHRPLTPQGVRSFRKQVLKHRKLFRNVDLWVTSPYLRAKETLDVIFEVLEINEAQVCILPKLTPQAKPAQLRDWLAKRKEKVIVFVSHEPFLSGFLNQQTDAAKSDLKFKKGAIAVVDLKRNHQKYKLKALFNP